MTETLMERIQRLYPGPLGELFQWVEDSRETLSIAEIIGILNIAAYDLLKSTTEDQERNP